VKRNKTGTMFVCIDLNFTRNYSKALLEKPFQTSIIP
jgi:hypothetical protein